MRAFRASDRRRLDERLIGLDERIGPRPPRGWIRAVRDALGMSTTELASRLGITHSRVCQLERAELSGAIQLSTLERVAQAMCCEVRYVLVPKEPFADMVYRQARTKAAAKVDEASELLDARTYQLIDSQGLWRSSTPSQPLTARTISSVTASGSSSGSMCPLS
jgi:predicted DNA-binding mobile mystery protein A